MFDVISTGEEYLPNLLLVTSQATSGGIFIGIQYFLPTRCTIHSGGSRAVQHFVFTVGEHRTNKDTQAACTLLGLYLVCSYHGNYLSFRPASHAEVEPARVALSVGPSLAVPSQADKARSCMESSSNWFHALALVLADLSASEKKYIHQYIFIGKHCGYMNTYRSVQGARAFRS